MACCSEAAEVLGVGVDVCTRSYSCQQSGRGKLYFLKVVLGNVYSGSNSSGSSSSGRSSNSSSSSSSSRSLVMLEVVVVVVVIVC